MSELRPELQAEGPPELSPGQRVRRGAPVPLLQMFQVFQAQQPPEEPSAVVRQHAAQIPVRHLQEEVHAQGQHENAQKHHTQTGRDQHTGRGLRFLQRMANRRFGLTNALVNLLRINLYKMF